MLNGWNTIFHFVLLFFKLQGQGWQVKRVNIPISNKNSILYSGQKNALTQETELLESILQEVEHQVINIKITK